jgi:hypothetical protein
VRELVSNIIKKLGSSVFLKQLKNGNIAPAVAFMANVIKEYGAIKESIELFEVAHKEDPSNVSYVLNLVHTLEITLEYQKAHQIIVTFMKSNPNVKVGEFFKSDEFLKVLTLLLINRSLNQ